MPRIPTDPAHDRGWEKYHSAIVWGYSPSCGGEAVRVDYFLSPNPKMRKRGKGWILPRPAAQWFPEGEP